MIITEHCNKPAYLKHKRISTLLITFLQCLDERRLRLEENPGVVIQRIMEAIKPGRFPELFDPQLSSEDEMLWNDIKQIVAPTKMPVRINPTPQCYGSVVVNPATNK